MILQDLTPYYLLKKLIEVDKPDSAFVAMLRLTSFLNAGAAKLPSIISRLEKWINKIKFVLKEKMGKWGQASQVHKIVIK